MTQKQDNGFFEVVDEEFDTSVAESTSAEQHIESTSTVEDKIAYFSNIPNIGAYIESKVRTIYHTSAVKAIELVLCADKYIPQITRNVYKNVAVAVAAEIDAKWVKKSVIDCKQKWTKSEYVSNYIQRYYDSIGIDPTQYEETEESLIRLLPVSIQQEDSPKRYKLYKAIEYLLHQCNSEDCDMILSAMTEDVTVKYNYVSKVEDYVAAGVPVECAEAIVSCEVTATEGVSLPLGLFTGKDCSESLRAITTFNEAAQLQFGEDVNGYVKYREEHANSISATTEQAANNTEVVDNTPVQSTNSVKTDNTTEVERRRENAVDQSAKPVRKKEASIVDDPIRRDLAPSVPLPVYVLVAHVVLALLVALISVKTAVFMCVGLVLAFVGWCEKYKQDTQPPTDKAPNAVLHIVLGYAVAVFAIALF